MPMRKVRPRYPKKKDVAMALRVLETLPKDAPLTMGWRFSEKHTPNFRIQGQIGRTDWTVDIYAGQYYIVRVGSRLGEECNSLSTAVAYIYRMLKIKRLSDV